MKRVLLIALTLALEFNLRAEFQIARAGKAEAEILVNADAPEPVQRAARELADTLKQITGAEFPIQHGVRANGRVIEVAQKHELKPDEIEIRSTDARISIQGGGTRGAFYAVSYFLQKGCGVRWWTPWAARIPKKADLSVPEMRVRHRPPFELREPFWMPAFDAEWSMRNFCNGQSAHIPKELGGSVQYKGFVHTFYPLVPPEKYFGEHPEWYSLIKGKRTHDRAQLCLTNPQLKDFVVERVKEWLRESPEASIVSVSQNDWYGACECGNCKAVDEAEGSHSGTMLAFVNYVAEKIEGEFPNVSVDTLAYQYTRKPPETLRPRRNVIVRLCSIECNFREPLDHPSNAAFAQDIEGWSKLTDRLYIWDYTTDFSHYVQPHPNWFTLGPNVRFFARHSVRGLFEQGAYQSHGSEMAELRAWVLAQLLWNPEQDDRALIREFLEGYYGPEAAPHIEKYLGMMREASAGQNLTCFARTEMPFFNIKTLRAAEELWNKAENAAAGNEEALERIRLARLPVRYVWLVRWDALRRQAEEEKLEWPLPASKQIVVEEWRATAKGREGQPWTKVTLINESGLKPEDFLKRFLAE